MEVESSAVFLPTLYRMKVKLNPHGKELRSTADLSTRRVLVVGLFMSHTIGRKYGNGRIQSTSI